MSKTVIIFSMFILIGLMNCFSLGKSNLKKKQDCRGINKWSYDIAAGRVAPWTYSGGNKVVHKNVLYEAMWGGQEEPGSHYCTSRQACSFNGWQWITIGKCKKHNHHHHHNNNNNSNNGYNGDYDNYNDNDNDDEYKNICVGKIPKFSSQIANGQIAPWTYHGGDKVYHENKIYIANWGGQEVPGSRPCSGVADCKNKGIQWVYSGKCRIRVIRN